MKHKHGRPKLMVVMHEYSIDAQTGRIELHLKTKSSEDNVTWEGPIKQYSADPQTLRDRFNNNLDDFIGWAKREHLSIVGVKPGLAEALESRKGKVIE
jgi:hypothetical protein